MRKLAILCIFLFLAVLTGGCADENDGAPNTDQPHPLGAQWLLPDEHPKAAIDNAPPCFTCHQETGGAISPACRDCHSAGPPNFVLGTCDSCHAKPPDGTARPNRAGAHAAHNALPKVNGVCNTCHNGAGSGTLKHYDTSSPADVAFLAAYNAKSGAASFPPPRATPVPVPAATSAATAASKLPTGRPGRSTSIRTVPAATRWAPLLRRLSTTAPIPASMHFMWKYSISPATSATTRASWRPVISAAWIRRSSKGIRPRPFRISSTSIPRPRPAPTTTRPAIRERQEPGNRQNSWWQ